MNKKIINRLAYVRLRNGAHLQMLRDIMLRIVGNPAAVAVFPNTLFTLFLKELDYEEQSFKVAHKSKFTAGLDVLDARRDRVFRGLVHTVKGLLDHFDTAKEVAARQVMEVLEKYGNVAELPRDEESAGLIALCADLKSNEMKASVELLGLAEWIDKLAEVAESYNAIESKRVEESAEHAGYSMPKARAGVDKALRMLLNYVEILVSTDPTEALEKLVAELNAIFKHYEQVANLEHAQRADGTDGNSEEGEEEIVTELGIEN